MTNEYINLEKESDEYLIFEIGKDLFALNISYVKEVINVNKVTTFPSMPDFIHGVLSLRGNIIPLVSINSLFNLTSRNLCNNDTIILICIEDSIVGLLIDTIFNILAIEKDRIYKINKANTFKSGFFELSNKGITILHIDNIINYMELALSV